MTFDPFANHAAPQDKTPIEGGLVNATLPAATFSPTADNKVTLTFKAGAGYEAPWIVVHGANIDDAYEQIEGSGEKLASLMDKVARAANYFQTNYQPPAKPQGKPSFQGGKVQQQAQPSEGGYTCEHGARNYKNGGSWEAQFCGAPQGVPKAEQCPPLWKQKDGSFKAK
ncbi:hypothetical protein ACH4YO_07870 [Streptomyces noursei]|uniref:hypothetical protein n=1 Tax=Streptomyces noursei TaxID=1971 RepID=UPI0034033724